MVSDIPAEDGKVVNLFLQCTMLPLRGTAVYLVPSVEYGVKQKFAIITATGIYADEGTDTVVLSVYMYFVVEFLDALFRVIPQNFIQRNVRKEFHPDENPHNSTLYYSQKENNIFP